VGALVVGVGLLYRRNRTAFFFAAFAAVTFAPGSNLLFATGTIMAERLIYLPCLGVMACVVLAIYAISQRVSMPVLPPIAVGLILAAFLMRTWDRNADWQSDLTLFKSAAQASPNSYKAHHLYARWAFNADPGLASNRVTSDASLSNLNLVIAEAEKSIAILDTVADSRNVSDPYLSAAEYYVLKADYLQPRAAAEAAAAYRRGLQITLRALPLANAERKTRNARESAAKGRSSADAADADKDPEAYELLALLYLRTGNLEKAIETGGVARALAPLSPEVHHQMAETFRTEGRADDAAAALAEGIIITSSAGLKQELADFYRKSDPKGCELVQTPNGFQINHSCEAVRKHFCAAGADSLRATLRIGRQDLADIEKKTLLQDDLCPPGPLDEVLPSKSGY
jgi:tetratricopeptide (TPR) repeat protein